MQIKPGKIFIELSRMPVYQARRIFKAVINSLGIPGQMQKGANMNMVPLRRAGTVDDASGAMLLLASPYASYITGHCLEVTGGVGI